VVDTPNPNNGQSETGSNLDNAIAAPEPANSFKATEEEQHSEQQHRYSQYIMRLLKASGGGTVRTVNWLDEKAGFVTAVATVLIAVLTGFYVHYSRAQWRTMQDEIPLLKSSAQAAQSAADIAASALIASSRAWISPTGAGLDRPLKLHDIFEFFVQYSNPGKSPAMDVHPIYTITPIEAARFDDNSFNSIIESTDICRGLEAVSGADVVYPEQPSGYSFHFRVKDQNWVTQDMIDGKVAIVIRMCFAYKTMNALHHTSFCYFYRAGVTDDFRKLNVCTAGNHAD
jgi:hypothetical protein